MELTTSDVAIVPVGCMRSMFSVAFIRSPDGKLFSFSSATGAFTAAEEVRLSLLALFCLGRELVMLELVADMKLLLAALRNGVGSALRILWLVGIALVGGSGVWALAPNTDIWDGGIHGASRCILPRICCGILSAVASA